MERKRVWNSGGRKTSSPPENLKYRLVEALKRLQSKGISMSDATIKISKGRFYD